MGVGLKRRAPQGARGTARSATVRPAPGVPQLPAPRWPSGVWRGPAGGCRLRPPVPPQAARLPAGGRGRGTARSATVRPAPGGPQLPAPRWPSGGVARARWWVPPAPTRAAPSGTTARSRQGRGELRDQPPCGPHPACHSPRYPGGRLGCGAGPLGCRLRPPVPPQAARLPAGGGGAPALKGRGELRDQPSAARTRCVTVPGTLVAVGGERRPLRGSARSRQVGVDHHVAPVARRGE